MRTIRRARVWSRTPERTRAVCAEGAEEVRHARRSGRVARVLRPWCGPHLHRHGVARAGAAGSTGSRTAPTSTRLAQRFPRRGNSTPAAVARSRLYVDRRESALAEAGDILIPISEWPITADHIRGELGEVLMGARARSRVDRRRDRVQVVRPGDRGPGRGAAHLRGRRGARHRRLGVARRPSERRVTSRAALHLPTLTDIEAAREQLAGLAVRTPLVRLAESRVTQSRVTRCG